MPTSFNCKKRSITSTGVWAIVILAGFWVITGCTSAGEDRPPNIVLIMADDLGYETIGCYGGESYEGDE